MFKSWGEKEFILFKYLLKNSTFYFWELEKNLPFSRVSIKNALDNINYFLRNNNIKEIEKKGGIFHFPSTELEDFSIQCNFFSTNTERFDYLLIKLIFKKELVLTKEVETLEVSRKTLENILNNIKNFVSTYELEIISQPWSGYYLKGDINNIIKLSYEFLTYLLLSKSFNPDFYRIFDFHNSNLVYKTLYTFIQKKDIIECENFIKEIFDFLNCPLDLFYYNLNVSIVLILKQNISFLNSFTYETIQNKNYKLNINSLFKILDKYPNLSCIKYYIPYFLEIFYEINPTTIKPKDRTICFLHELKNIFEFDITSSLLSKSECCINFIDYKIKYNLKFYNLRFKDYPPIYTETFYKSLKIFNKYFTNISEENSFIIISTLKKFFISSKNFNKNILIIIPELFKITAVYVKKELINKYFTNDVDILYAFQNFSWDYINNKYDLIFFISNFDLNIYNDNIHIRIPYYTIKGNEFINDPHYFTKFNIISNLKE
ncbi:hypothetical protein NON08_12655 [Cetobacterium somerae]|uniref:hypothetical protein n=1 Tax=Cetobacterium sp. NK01 TaxID=2993530 RepID=UPI002115DB50|nr:hypothetical protein [Cetobacterium sp. NK01]MCQ8213351.1 hypothetical protein [Cetobacterium sp. NK01]